jgi:hypothetical protein
MFTNLNQCDETDDQQHQDDSCFLQSRCAVGLSLSHGDAITAQGD